MRKASCEVRERASPIDRHAPTDRSADSHVRAITDCGARPLGHGCPRSCLSFRLATCARGRMAFVSKPLDIAPSKPHLGVMPFGNSSEVRALFRNPEAGIVSTSPGLRGTSYPGLRETAISTPTGLRLLDDATPQPRWGCLSLTPFPRVARPSQPWALSRNPFGIRTWDFRKASH